MCVCDEHVCVCVSVQLSESSEFSLWEYLLTTRPGIGWIKGTASVTGVVLQVFICLMVLCSSTFVRRSGHFEVSGKTSPGATGGEQRPRPDEPDENASQIYKMYFSHGKEPIENT